MIDTLNPYRPGTDEYFIFDAVQLARGGLGWTSPNPMVGCVLVRDGKIIGRGFHEADGGLHAEAAALKDAGDASAATCYVTLEPCSHQGRQPSCCHLLQEAGVTRVVYGSTDADPRTSGRAAGILNEAGIEVTGGVLAGECDRLIDYYLHAKQHGRLFAHLKLAVSLDAKLACANGASQWLSGPMSLGYAHYLRQRYDAIMVGSGTVLADNPRLTTRREVLENYHRLADGVETRSPCRVIFDPRQEVIRTEIDFALAKLTGGFPAGMPGLIVITCGTLPRRSPILEHAELLITPPGGTGRIDFEDVFSKLWNLGVRSMVIEGGARLARELLRQRSIDRISLVYTSCFIGGDGLGITPDMELSSLDECPRLTGCRGEELGEDFLVDGYFPSGT